jgi:hypothetical protein
VRHRSDLDDPGIVHEHIDGAAVVDDAGDGGVDLRAVGDIADDGRRVESPTEEVLPGPFELVLVARGQHDVRAGLREFTRHDQA